MVNVPQPDSIRDEIVDVSCGQCQLGMAGTGCDLAIRWDNQCYFVSGPTIDDYGDAHAEDGFCNCIRKARVTGTLANGRVSVQELELLGSP